MSKTVNKILLAGAIGLSPLTACNSDKAKIDNVSPKQDTTLNGVQKDYAGQLISMEPVNGNLDTVKVVMKDIATQKELTFNAPTKGQFGDYPSYPLPPGANTDLPDYPHSNLYGKEVYVTATLTGVSADGVPAAVVQRVNADVPLGSSIEKEQAESLSKEAHVRFLQETGKIPTPKVPGGGIVF